MLEDILRSLERESRRLEPDAAGRRQARDAVLRYADGFIDAIEQNPTFVETDVCRPDWRELDISDRPTEIDAALSTIEHLVDRPGLNPASGGHMGYIPGGGIPTAALGDYLAAITNRFAGVAFASPGAVRLEHALVRWMSNLIGLPRESAGNLTSGGSIANLIAIVCARDESEIAAQDWKRAVVYSTEQAHHCLDKALRIAGVGDCIRRNVPMDSRFRMDVGALHAAVEDDRRHGRIPWMIVATAGTTDVGAIDPLNAIADIAREQGVWLHVDAAYGGFFVLTETGRAKLRGIEQADSVVMDPHKGLFLPYGLGAVLVRDRAVLRRSFEYQAAYMQDARDDPDGDSPADLSPEMSKHFRGLRLWLPLKLHGIAPFRACLDEKLLLARYAWEQLKAMPGFELFHEPELSVVAFRFVPREGDANEFNRRLRERIQADGRVFLSSTLINGNVALRIAALAFRTHLDHVRTALSLLKQHAHEMQHAAPARID